MASSRRSASPRCRIFFPRDGYTKRDLVDYYRSIAPFILRYLRDRPVVLTRFPDGIDGKSFFQKDAPGFTPDWLRTERMWSEHAEREIDAFVCEDEASLAYIANLGTIPLHIWASRVTSLQRPDWCILDFDPKGAPFTDVVALARAAHDLCDSIGLPSFAKTSGQAGMHVLVPTGGALTFEQTKTLGELLATVLASEHAAIATIVRNPARRGGKVYVDFLQNGHGKLLVAPYCVRPVDGAQVSTPLEWREVTKKLDPSAFTIATVPKRMARRDDPLMPLLNAKPNIAGALQKLLKRIE
jgi:bifunctional non-homologous end joining protein LigD